MAHPKTLYALGLAAASLAAWMPAASACAEDVLLPVPGAPTVQPAQISDPLEGFNRRMFAIDKGIGRIFGHRTVAGSAHFLPRPVRNGLYNFFNNLDEPASFANETLQLKFGKAAVSVGRFATNSTVGVFGTMDVASRIGLRRHREDLGQTLAMYGVKPGPYIFLPLSGPTTLRDKVGDRIDGFAKPLHWVGVDMVTGQAVNVTHQVVQPHVLTVRERARLAAESGESADEYATLRQLYYEQRAAEIADIPSADALIAPLPPPRITAEVEDPQAYPQAAPDDDAADGPEGYQGEQAEQARDEAAWDAYGPPPPPRPADRPY